MDGPACVADSLLLFTLKVLWGYKLVSEGRLEKPGRNGEADGAGAEPTSV